MKKNAILILSFVVLISLIFSKNTYADEDTCSESNDGYINYWDQSIVKDDMDIEEFTFLDKYSVLFE